MGIRFFCPNGHKLNVKAFQAGQRGICPVCGTKVQIPLESTRPSSSKPKAQGESLDPDHGDPAAESELEAELPVFQEISTLPPESPAGEFPSGEDVPSRPVGSGGPTAEAQEAGSPQQPAAAPSPICMDPTDSAGANVSGFPPEVSPVGPPPLAADPLSDAADIVWYVRPPSGGQYGPATSSVMRAWIDEGRVPPDALVWREGWRDWQRASDVFSQLRADEEAESLEAIAQRSSSLAHGRTLAHPGPVRTRSKSKKTTLILLLVLAAIVLFAIFLWVVFSGPRSTAMVLIAPATASVTAVGQRRFFRLRKPQPPT